MIKLDGEPAAVKPAWATPRQVRSDAHRISVMLEASPEWCYNLQRQAAGAELCIHSLRSRIESEGSTSAWMHRAIKRITRAMLPIPRRKKCNYIQLRCEDCWLKTIIRDTCTVPVMCSNMQRTHLYLIIIHLGMYDVCGLWNGYVTIHTVHTVLLSWSFRTHAVPGVRSISYMRQ